jgi:hypothetical protein
VEVIGKSCFADCKKLETVTFASDSKLALIETEAFQTCVSLRSFCLPPPVEFIGGSCFRYCNKLETVTFAPDSKLARIENFAFDSCLSLKSFVLPSSVEFIGEGCFQGCSVLETVTLPYNAKLIRIEAAAFSGCVTLKSLRIPSSVEFVGVDCFRECAALSKISLSLPSHLRELLDLRGRLIDMPDSVQRLQFSIGRTRQTFNFGPESKLNGIAIDQSGARGRGKCFLRFSTGTLKVFRSGFEF